MVTGQKLEPLQMSREMKIYNLKIVLYDWCLRNILIRSGYFYGVFVGLGGLISHFLQKAAFLPFLWSPVFGLRFIANCR
jgi:hypothetical protein